MTRLLGLIPEVWLSFRGKTLEASGVSGFKTMSTAFIFGREFPSPEVWVGTDVIHGPHYTDDGGKVYIFKILGASLCSWVLG